MFSRFALGQSLSPGDFDLNNQGDQYSGQVARGQRRWPALKQNLDVDLNPGATVFRLPQFMYDRSLVTPDQSKYDQCSPGPGVNAKLVGVNGDMAIIRLHGDHCGGSFNQGDRDPNLAFVKVSELGALTKHEALLPSLLKPICKLAHEPFKLLGEFAMHANATGIKDDADLDAYFACYKSKHHADYTELYEKLIGIAGQTFGIRVSADGKRTIMPASAGENAVPFIVGSPKPFVIGAKEKIMKCLIFRESGWDAANRNKVSKAAGLGQQTDDDVGAIKCLLEGCKKPFEVVKKGKKEIVMKSVPPQAWAQTLWHDYFAKARASMTASEWKKLNTNAQTGEPCTETMAVKTRDAYCPMNSIAAIAIDQVAIELIVRENTPKYKDDDNHDFGQDELHELLLIYGSSHDAGISKAAQATRSSDDIFAWAKVLVANKKASRNKELSGYHKDLSNCVNDGNFEPMSGYVKPKAGCAGQ